MLYILRNSHIVATCNHKNCLFLSGYFAISERLYSEIYSFLTLVPIEGADNAFAFKRLDSKELLDGFTILTLGHLFKLRSLERGIQYFWYRIGSEILPDEREFFQKYLLSIN